MSDGAGPGDEDDESDGAVGGDSTGGGNVTPVIVTSGLVVETTEGTTVNLPCKVTVGSRKYHRGFRILIIQWDRAKVVRIEINIR